jgi:hypothetical protein
MIQVQVLHKTNFHTAQSQNFTNDSQASHSSQKSSKKGARMINDSPLNDIFDENNSGDDDLVQEFDLSAMESSDSEYENSELPLVADVKKVEAYNHAATLEVYLPFTNLYLL